MTLEDVAKLFYLMNFIAKFHILANRRQQRKKWIKWKSCILSIPVWSAASIFSFSVRKGFKISENLQNRSKKGIKVGYTFSRIVRARRHVHWPKQLKTAWETKLYICWWFGEFRASFGHAIDTWKKCYFCYKQTDKQTDAAQFYYRFLFWDPLSCSF